MVYSCESNAKITDLDVCQNCRSGAVCLDVINQSWSPMFGNYQYESFRSKELSTICIGFCWCKRFSYFVIVLIAQIRKTSLLIFYELIFTLSLATSGINLNFSCSCHHRSFKCFRGFSSSALALPKSIRSTEWWCCILDDEGSKTIRSESKRWKFYVQ